MTRRPVRVGGALLLAFVVLVAFPLEHREGIAAPKFGDWSAAVNLGSAVNTEYGEFAPHTSNDGLSLYFASTRPAAYGSFGGEDLWISQRASTDAPWGLPMNLGQVVNTASNDRSPALSRDGHYLFFASNRAGGFGGLDIWVSWRPNTHDDFGWEAPVNLGAAVNSASTDAGPGFFENDDAGIPHLYVASNRPGGLGLLDIYVSELVGGAFQPPTLVQGLNTAQNDLTPGITFDGLEIIIASNRPGGVGEQDLWTATRDTVDTPWSTLLNLGTVNSTLSDNFPSISADRRSLIFNSPRSGGFGDSDLYVSTRAK
jgi:Tol biopolymer transport system component